MSYRLYQFGSLALPSYTYRTQAEVQAQTRKIDTLSGYFDPDRGGVAPLKFPYPLSHKITVYQAGGVAALGAALDALRARLGTTDILSAHPLDSTQADRWAWARLARVPYVHQFDHRVHQPLELAFDVFGLWNGAAHAGTTSDNGQFRFGNMLYLDAAAPTTLDTSPKNITLNNGGNYAVDGCGLTITAGGAAITALTVACNGATEWTYTGTIASGQTLHIDAARKIVRNNGADAFGAFALTSNHKLPVWLRLLPGDNTLTVTITGGSTDSTICATYADGWV
jgi:hypothetical protein